MVVQCLQPLQIKLWLYNVCRDCKLKKKKKKKADCELFHLFAFCTNKIAIMIISAAAIRVIQAFIAACCYCKLKYLKQP